MSLILKRPVLQPLKEALFAEKQLDVSVLRLDTMHPYVSGNKIYKLKYNIEEFRRSGKEYLVTFGGAYSNHIVATAAAGKEYGIKTIGIIRGNELNDSSNAHLRFAGECGMDLKFVTRELYRKWRDHLKPENGTQRLEVGGGKMEMGQESTLLIPSGLQRQDLGFRFPVSGIRFPISSLHHQVSGSRFPTSGFRFPTSSLYFLPEGGSNDLAVKGCREILTDLTSDFDIICCACGTGATLAGISTALDENKKAIGIAVLQGEAFLENDILDMNGGKSNFAVLHDFHFGGYAKRNNELEDFCHSFSKTHQLPVEPVYTGKLFFALYHLARKNFFKPRSRIVMVHSGGVFESKS